MPAKISVIIPGFNHARFLEHTLLSVLGQGYPKLEVLVLDGGSTDGSLEIIQRYADRLAFWRSRPDGGQAEAINEGMERAEGDILCWLNSDDLFMPGALLDAAASFEDVSSPELCYGTCIGFREKSEGLEAFPFSAGPFDRERLARQAYILQPSTFWTQAMWKAVGPLNAQLHYAFDWEWFLRAAAVRPFRFQPKAYSLFRYHAGNKTTSGTDQRKAEILSLVNQYASKYWRELYLLVLKYFRELSSLGKPVQAATEADFVAAMPEFWRHARLLAATLSDIYVAFDMLRG